MPVAVCDSIESFPGISQPTLLDSREVIWPPNKPPQQRVIDVGVIPTFKLQSKQAFRP
jgi:hypothetical protein